MAERDGLYWEEFEEGREWPLGRRTVTRGDVERFAELSGDRNPLHLDAAYAAGTPFGRPIAHGALGFAVATGLIQAARLTAGTLVALVGVRWSFVSPLYPDAAVTGRVRVGSRRPTSSPERGIVVLEAVLETDGGERVQEGELTYLIRKRGGPAS